MCNCCRLTTPSAHEVCHACAIAIRAEARRGLDQIERYLDGWALLERGLTDEE